jgi:hypothetical protein
MKRFDHLQEKTEPTVWLTDRFKRVCGSYYYVIPVGYLAMMLYHFNAGPWLWVTLSPFIGCALYGVRARYKSRTIPLQKNRVTDKRQVGMFDQFADCNFDEQ